MDGALWTCLVLLLKHYLKERSSPRSSPCVASVLWIGQYLRSKETTQGSSTAPASPQHQ